MYLRCDDLQCGRVKSELSCVNSKNDCPTWLDSICFDFDAWCGFASVSRNHRDTLSFWDQGWCKSKIKINWPRSLVIGVNDVKKGVTRLFVQYCALHKSASVFHKDFQNYVDFEVWKSFDFQYLQYFKKNSKQYKG